MRMRDREQENAEGEMKHGRVGRKNVPEVVLINGRGTETCSCSESSKKKMSVCKWYIIIVANKMLLSYLALETDVVSAEVMHGPLLQ